MVNLDIDLEGAIDLQETFEDLEDEWTTDTTFVVESGAEYAIYVEMGTEDMPPYPYFRPAIREFQAKPRSFVLDNTAYSSFEEIENGDKLVQAVARALESQMKTNATAEAPGRSPGTHPDHPQVQTTNLRSRIKARRV